MASKLSGAAGALGVEAIKLRNWFLCFGYALEEFIVVVANIADWMYNSSPPWATYCALMEFCLIALDKRPGVRPIGIGEKLHQAIAKLVMRASGDQAKAAYRIHQLCTGLEAGIEGVTHAVAQRRRERTVTAPEGMGEEELEDMVLWKWT